MRGLLLLFLMLPIVELWLMIKVGSVIGALPTIGLLMLAGALGLLVLRVQGLATLTAAQDRLQRGESPGAALVEGLLLAVGGLLLLIPGFLTDAFALPLLLPPTRKALGSWLLRSGNLQAWGGRPGAATFTTFTFRGGSMHRDAGRFYEGEFSRDSDAGQPLAPPPADDGEK